MKSRRDRNGRDNVLFMANSYTVMETETLLSTQVGISLSASFLYQTPGTSL